MTTPKTKTAASRFKTDSASNKLPRESEVIGEYQYFVIGDELRRAKKSNPTCDEFVTAAVKAEFALRMLRLSAGLRELPD